MFPKGPYPITVAETEEFRSVAEVLLAGEEIDELVEFLAFNPHGADVIPDTGGVRELLWKKPGTEEGKGIWVVYYFHDLNMPLYVLTACTEGDHDELTDAEREVMRGLVEELVGEHSRRLRERLSSGA